MLKPGKIFRSPKIFSRHKKKKNIIKQDKLRAIVPLALDIARPGHINISVNVVKSGVKKSFSNFKERGRNGLPIATEVDFEREEKMEQDRNYDITNIKERRLRSGKHKGDKVEITVVNNPPGVRYKLRAWK
jgi:hypothetical protein